MKFEAGSNKGGVKQKDLFNDVFALGEMTDERMNYSGAAITEAVTTFTSGTTKVAWSPVIAGTIRALDADGNEVSDNKTTAWTVNAEGVVTEGAYVGGKSATDVKKLAYVYDNVTIPQNDIPQVTARMEGIELTAKARRLAIYYSQMAAFQARTELGIDLGEILATQACAELAYEIDTEIVKLLTDSATVHDDLKWSKTLPIGVNKRDHYAGFAEIIEIGSQHIYDETQKHAANYMICASNIKPILVLMDGFKAASTAKINGPYYAGELNGLKVYISPAVKPGTFVLGYNGGDMTTSAAVYAPYMAIVPTQLLGFADGAMSQGFSTLYDLKLLNKRLLVKGEVTK